jgi:hypothetical protein
VCKAGVLARKFYDIYSRSTAIAISGADNIERRVQKKFDATLRDAQAQNATDP